MCKRYDITLRYITPGGRAGEYRDIFAAATIQDAVALAEKCLSLEPRRRVGMITGYTLALADL